MSPPIGIFLYYLALSTTTVPPPSPAPTSQLLNHSTKKPFFPPLSRFDTSMTLIILFLLTCILFVSLFSFFVRRVSQRRRIQHRTFTWSGGSKFYGLDASIIQSLPLRSYDEAAKYSTDCTVCLCEFGEKEIVKLIPNCGHVFHPECIDKWLYSHITCPLCRSTNLIPVGQVKMNVVEAGTLDEAAMVENGDTLVEREREVAYSSVRGTGSGSTSSSTSSILGERMVLERSSSM